MQALCLFFAHLIFCQNSKTVRDNENPSRNIGIVRAHEYFFSKEIILQPTFSKVEIETIKKRHLNYRVKKYDEYSQQKKINQAKNLIKNTDQQIELFGRFLDEHVIEEIHSMRNDLERKINIDNDIKIDDLIVSLSKKWQVISQELYLKGVNLSQIKREHFTKYLNRISSKIAIGKLDETISELLANIEENRYPQHYKELLLQSFDLHEINKKFNLNLINHEKYSLRQSQIAYSVLNIISNLKNEKN